jgi:hypothetical protein
MEASSIYTADPKAMAAEVLAANPGTSNYTPEQLSYAKSQVSELAADRIERAAENDVVARASESFKASVEEARVGNIHQAREVPLPKVEANAAPSDPSFDGATHEETFGLSSGAMNKLGITDGDTAHQAVQGIAKATAGAATPEEVEEFIGGFVGNDEAMSALRTAVSAELERWSSPRYGTAANRNSAQAAEVYKLVQHVLAQTIGLHKNELNVPQLPALMKRSRSVLDPDYSPAQKQSQPSPLRDPNAPTNIHSLFMRNPF